ncbi:unnamed protein product [Caenorhabditis nigoni]
MRLLLTTLLILYNLPLTNTTSIYEFSQPEYRIGKNHNVKIWKEIGTPELNRTDTRFLFHSSKFGFKNPNFIQNVSDFLMDNSFSTFNLIADATDDILENSEKFSIFPEKPTLWIIDFQTRDYAKIFPQFKIRDLSCDEFGEFEIFIDISKNLISFSWRRILNFYDIILLESDETTNYTYSPYPEYREELRNLENMKRQRYFQNIYIDALHELSREWSDYLTALFYHAYDFSVEIPVVMWIRYRWPERLDLDHFNVFYTLRKLAYFMISKLAEPDSRLSLTLFCYSFHVATYFLALENTVNFFRQLMFLELLYKLAKYTVDDIRSVIWPSILANEIWDVFAVFEYRTTEYLTFELQLVKILHTFEYFLLLNQYPDFSILIWLLVIFSLQLFSFSLYFLFPPITWTVPVLNIAPIIGPRNQYMIYTRYVAIGLILVIFGYYWEQLSPKL